MSFMEYEWVFGPLTRYHKSTTRKTNNVCIITLENMHKKIYWVDDTPQFARFHLVKADRVKAISIEKNNVVVSIDISRAEFQWVYLKPFDITILPSSGRCNRLSRFTARRRPFGYEWRYFMHMSTCSRRQVHFPLLHSP